MNYSPPQCFWSTGAIVSNLFGLSRSASNIYHRGERLKVWFLYTVADVIYCIAVEDGRWPKKWQYCMKCSSSHKTNKPPNKYYSLNQWVPAWSCVSLQLQNWNPYASILYIILWRTISNHTLLHDLLYTHTLQTCKCSWLVCVTPGWFYIDLHHLTLWNDSLAEQVWWQSHNTRTLTTDWNRTRWFASLLYVCVRYDNESHVFLLMWIVVVCV